MAKKETKIIIAGFGGQGVVVTGNIIARASLIEDKFVTGMVSYGAEMRGGTANSSVIVSNEPIGSPFVERPDIAIVLNQPSMDKFQSKVLEGGTIIANSSMIDAASSRTDVDAVMVDATDIAKKLGNIRTANVVAIGAFVAAAKILKPESFVQAITDLFSSKKPELVDLNVNALKEGIKAVS